MKKILLLFALFVGLSSCETADEEPTMQQLVGEFEMTAELGEQLVSMLPNHLAILTHSYNNEWGPNDATGGSTDGHYFGDNGFYVQLVNAISNQINHYMRYDDSWSYDYASNILQLGYYNYQIAYFKPPMLMLRDCHFGSYFEYRLTSDVEEVEEYLRKYLKHITPDALQHQIAGRVLALKAYHKEKKYYANGQVFDYIWTPDNEEYIYFAEDGTGIGFFDEYSENNRKTIKYQRALQWKWQSGVDPNLTYDDYRPIIWLNGVPFRVTMGLEQYYSAQKSTIGFELKGVEPTTNVEYYVEGFFDDYDLDHNGVVAQR